jgi:hypothetical protein
VVTLLAIGALGLGFLSLWLQARGYHRHLSLSADILAVLLIVVILLGGIMASEPFRYSYRIAMFYFYQTWVLSQALMRVRISFSTTRTIYPFALALGFGALQYALIKETFPFFFRDALKNPTAYIETSLVLSTLATLTSYAISVRLFPIATERHALYKKYFLKTLTRAAVVQFVGMVCFLCSAYLLQKSQYWAAKSLALITTPGLLGRL